MITVQQIELVKAIEFAVRFSVPRGTLPILNNLHLQATGGLLSISATNLAIYGRTSIPCTEGELDFTVPARNFADYIKLLPLGEVTLGLKDKTKALTVTAQKHRCNFKGIVPEEFPLFPSSMSETGSATFELLPNFFERLAEVFPASAIETSRPALNGVFFKSDGTDLTLVGADGFQLALTEMVMLLGQPQVKFILPRQLVVELVRHHPTSNITLSLNANRGWASVRFDNLEIGATLSDSNFPNYEAILPNTFATTVVIPRAELLQGLRTAEVIAREVSHTGYLSIKQGELTEPGIVKLSATAAETGDNQAEFISNTTGNDLSISFNLKFMKDYLTALGAPHLKLSFNSANQPLQISPVEDERTRYILMPMYKPS